MKIAKDKNIKRVDLKDKFEGTTFFFFLSPSLRELLENIILFKIN